MSTRKTLALALVVAGLLVATATPSFACAVCFGGETTKSAALWVSTALLLGLVVAIQIWVWRLFRRIAMADRNHVALGSVAAGSATAGRPGAEVSGLGDPS